MTIRLNGQTSGYVELEAPATAGSNTLVLPTNNGTSGQYLQTNGSGALSWAGIGETGKILQVVQTVKTDVYSRQSSSGDMGAITGFSATITPSSTSSKILITAMCSCGGDANQRFYVEARRGTTQLTNVIGDSDGANRRETTTVSFSNSNDSQANIFYQYLDSPNTTSAVTYNMYGGIEGANFFHLNRSRTDTNSIAVQRTASTIILMEVAG